MCLSSEGHNIEHANRSDISQTAVIREINNRDIRKLLKRRKNDALEGSDTCVAH